MLSKRYDLNHLDQMPLAFGCRMVFLAFEENNEEMLWQRYLSEHLHLKNPASYNDYKKDLKKRAKKEFENRNGPDKENFKKHFGDRIKRPGGGEK